MSSFSLSITTWSSCCKVSIRRALFFINLVKSHLKKLVGKILISLHLKSPEVKKSSDCVQCTADYCVQCTADYFKKIFFLSRYNFTHKRLIEKWHCTAYSKHFFVNWKGPILRDKDINDLYERNHSAYFRSVQHCIAHPNIFLRFFQFNSFIMCFFMIISVKRLWIFYKNFFQRTSIHWF